MNKNKQKAPLMDRIISFLISCVVISFKFTKQIFMGTLFGGGMTALMTVMMATVFGVFGFVILKLTTEIKLDFNQGFQILSIGAILQSFVYLFLFASMVLTVFEPFFIKNIRRLQGSYPDFFKKTTIFILAILAALLPFAIIATLGKFYHPTTTVFDIDQLQKSTQFILKQLIGKDTATLFSNLLPYYYILEIGIIFIGLFYKFAFTGKWVSVRRVGASVSVDGGPWHRDLD